MATAKEIMALKNKAAKPTITTVESSASASALVKPLLVAALVEAAAAHPKVEWKPKPRVCHYHSRAVNTTVNLANNKDFKFNGHYYTATDSKEIFELDSLCRRNPHVFTKVSEES